MLLACVCLSPAHAQPASRVNVAGAPAILNDDLRRLLKAEPAPQTLFDARRRADRAAAVVSKLMESEGYYQAQVEPYAEDAPGFPHGVRVATGPLYIVESTTISYPDTAPDAKTQASLDELRAELALGVPARAQPVLDLQQAMLQRLRAAGYPDARADDVDALADGRANTLELTFILRPGLRASFGALDLRGLDRTRRSYVEKLTPWKPGEFVSPRQIDELRGRLAETGLFDSANVQLADAGAGQDEPVSRDVVVDLRERKRRTFSIGAVASTSDGVGLETEWQQRNLTGRGDSISFNVEARTLGSGLSVEYKRPNVGHYGRNLEFAGSAGSVETDAYEGELTKVSGTVVERLTPRLKTSLGAEASYANVRLKPNDLAVGGRTSFTTFTIPATAEYIGVRDILDPHNGVRARLVVEPGVTWGDSEIGYTRTTGEVGLYGDLGSSKLVGALRAKAGAIYGPNGAPPDKLFFAGGGGSVRGYEYQSLSPRDASGNLLGGRSLVELSAEVRWRPGQRLGYVAFLDAGAAGESADPPLDDLRLGAGLGVRYYAGFGPLRADIAVPLDKRPGDADFQIYLSIGQAF